MIQLVQSRVIHEAGDAETPGPGHLFGPGLPGTTKTFHHFGTRKYLERKIAVSVNKISKRRGQQN